MSVLPPSPPLKMTALEVAQGLAAMFSAPLSEPAVPNLRAQLCLFHICTCLLAKELSQMDCLC